MDKNFFFKNEQIFVVIFPFVSGGSGPPPLSGPTTKKTLLYFHCSISIDLCNDGEHYCICDIPHQHLQAIQVINLCQQSK